MTIISVELMNSRALQLMRKLESMHIIRLRPSLPQLPKIKLSEKYRSILTKGDAININKHGNQMCSEWDNTF